MFLLQRGQSGLKFQVQVVTPHQPFFVSENWDNHTFMWYKNVGRSFFCFAIIHAFDGQTDGQMEGFILANTSKNLL